jgi:ABC-2 type transport system ATP-binding protein
MNSILEVKNIHKTFGKNKVLNDISIDVEKGKIFGLLGPNGAGKTTLIRIINQIIIADSGQIIFDGNPLKRSHVHDLGYLPEERGLYNKMKIGELLIYMAQLKGLYGKTAKDKILAYLREFDIMDWWNKKAETLSKGMQQKIQFILAIVHEPKLVILDEPFTGFDPVNIVAIKNKINELKEKGTTFILSTHRMDSVEELCDDIALINKSNKIIEGNKWDIKEKYKEDIFEFVVDNNYQPEGTSFAHKIISSQIENDRLNLKIKLSHQDQVKELLNEIISKTNIHSFNEVVPTINDIFISLVKKTENE